MSLSSRLQCLLGGNSWAVVAAAGEDAHVVDWASSPHSCGPASILMAREAGNRNKSDTSHDVRRTICLHDTKKETRALEYTPSTKTECDNLNGWIKDGHIRKNLTQNGEPQRYSWRPQKKNTHRFETQRMKCVCNLKIRQSWSCLDDYLIICMVAMFDCLLP